MAERQLLTIEKIPLRLSLQYLSAAECLVHSARNFFSSRTRHPMHHPLMHQIGANPDCQALAICADSIPLAISFFHFKTREAGKVHIILHNFTVAPYARGHGLGKFLMLLMLREIAGEDTRDLVLETEFPLPEGTPGNAAAFLDGAMTSQHTQWGEKELKAMQNLARSEIETLIPKILNSLITEPGYGKRMARQGCSLATISQSNDFFGAVSSAEWPAHVAVQAIHMGFHQNVEQKVEGFDMVLVDGEALKSHPNLLDTLSHANPELPLVVIGGPDDLNHPALLMRVDPSRLPEALATYLNPFLPNSTLVQGRPLRQNLLGLPERESMVYYRNRHRGKRLFIIASGPSLANVDPALFQNEITVTINDAITKFPFTRYAAIMDARKLHELHMALLPVEGLFTLKGNSYGSGINLLGTDGFSEDLEQGVFSGYTTAYFTLQIAIYMGFREIYYLGLDLGNTATQSHFFGNRSLQHRDRPEVYAKMRHSFEKITPRLKEMGVSVYNCSPVSELKCFPYRPIFEVLGES